MAENICKNNDSIGTFKNNVPVFFINGNFKHFLYFSGMISQDRRWDALAYQSCFKRYELKYLLTQQQKDMILKAMTPYMNLDKYGRTTIRNIYFDTDTYRLIRHSIEKPIYKEKLRLRSYQTAGIQDHVFVELKKKYNGIVYKRRISLQQNIAMDWISAKIPTPENSQIAREIDYFLRYYGALRPTVFLSYEREAFYCKDGSDFRVTFDDNLLCRREALTLDAEPGGESLLPPGQVLMEIKCSGGIPLWMVQVLSRANIYKTSFSKYGTAYQSMIFPELKGGQLNV